MKKEYNQPEENPETGKISEPVLSYDTTEFLATPCQYTPEEIREKYDRAVQQMKDGDYFSDEELDDFILHDIPKDYLLQQITQAEKDIKEGRLTTHEEMKKRFLK